MFAVFLAERVKKLFRFQKFFLATSEDFGNSNAYLEIPSATFMQCILSADVFKKK